MELDNNLECGWNSAIDVGFENIAVKEANSLGIPVIGVVDTNNSPEGIDYPIPGNDDALKSINFYAEQVADVIIAAQEAAAAGQVKGSEDDVSEDVIDSASGEELAS